MDKLKVIDLENTKEEGLAEGLEKGEQKGKLEERKLPWNMARSKLLYN